MTWVSEFYRAILSTEVLNTDFEFKLKAGLIMVVTSQIHPTLKKILLTP